MQVGPRGGGRFSGSMSTVSRDDNGVMSSEDSSSPDEAELELGLGLSLGGGGFRGQQAGRILTAKDLPSLLFASSSSASSFSSSSTSSSSSTLSIANGTSGTKRAADSLTGPNNASACHVVGWPPVRAYRMHSLVNQAKSLATEEFNSLNQKTKIKNTILEKVNSGSNMNHMNAKAKASLFVKVNMDGIPIGRKVDLNAHGSYWKLARALEDMFLQSTTTIGTLGSTAPEHNLMLDVARRSNLLDGSSEFVLTFEDKEGDWMLVGDVPWGMFLNSVKRLRIMRKSEATGLDK